MTAVEPAANAEDSTGRTLTIGGRYQVRRALGAGGMGVVYEARHNWTGRLVAVKVLSSERVREQGFSDRFAREARAAARVHHPNVVDVLDSGFDPDAGGFYIVQELLEGEDLRARLARERKLTPETAVELMVGVADGLTAVHEHQIVHRDVKPGNIFIARSPDGTTAPKVIDFGVSKLLDEPTTTDTTTGEVLGTPRYMAPEQLRGERDIDARADVWGAGAVLYEALAGRAPFDATNHNLLVFEVLSGAPVATIEGIPASLMAVVRRALERDRTKRFGSMSEFRDALIAWRYEPAARATRRVPRVAVALGLAALALAAAFAVRRPRAHTPAPAPRTEMRPEVAHPEVTRSDETRPPTPVASPEETHPSTAPSASPAPTPAPRHAPPTRAVRHPLAVTVAAPPSTPPPTPPEGPQRPPTPAVTPSSRARLLEPATAYPGESMR
ncbi:MAG: protein kinase [Polyangiales bacterium]